MAQKRIYRELYRGKDLVYFNVKVEQTDLNIAAHSMLRKEALQLARKYRKDIEEYIKRDHGFLSSLTPISCCGRSGYSPADVTRHTGRCGSYGSGGRSD